MKNDRREHFGLIGLKIGDIITFTHSGASYMVGSGNGTPGNGGTFVRDLQQDKPGLMTLRVATRRLLAESRPLEDGEDIWQHWAYQGQSLRDLLKRI